MGINIASYWPLPIIGRQVVNLFDCGIQHTYSHQLDGSIKLREEQTVAGKPNVWMDDWKYHYDPVRGILESEDLYPKTGVYKYFWWQTVKSVECLPGKEIVWGGVENIGETISAPCVTSGIFGQYGNQAVHFIELIPIFKTKAAGSFSNVLAIEYWQSWGSAPVGGGKLWLAPGRGQIKAQWSVNGVPTGFGMEVTKVSPIYIE